MPFHLQFYICRSSPHGSALQSGYRPTVSEVRYSQMQTHRYYIHRTPASPFRYNPSPEMHHAFYPRNYPMSKEWKFDHWRGQSLKNFYVTLSSGNHTIEIPSGKWQFPHIGWQLFPLLSFPVFRKALLVQPFL